MYYIDRAVFQGRAVDVDPGFAPELTLLSTLLQLDLELELQFQFCFQLQLQLSFPLCFQLQHAPLHQGRPLEEVLEEVDQAYASFKVNPLAKESYKRGTLPQFADFMKARVHHAIKPGGVVGKGEILLAPESWPRQACSVASSEGDSEKVAKAVAGFFKGEGWIRGDSGGEAGGDGDNDGVH